MHTGALNRAHAFSDEASPFSYVLDIFILNLLMSSSLLTAVVFRWEVDALWLESLVESSIPLVRPETV